MEEVPRKLEDFRRGWDPLDFPTGYVPATYLCHGLHTVVIHTSYITFTAFEMTGEASCFVLYVKLAHM